MLMSSSLLWMKNSKCVLSKAVRSFVSWQPITINRSVSNQDKISYISNPLKSTNFQHYHSTKLVNRQRVTLETAKKLPKNYDEMGNDILLSMAVMGDQEAREERLIREIMAVDSVSWEDAQPIFMKVVNENRAHLMWITLPYKIGIVTAVSAGILSIPMVFQYDLVLWFNEFFVTADVPEAKDLETALEVGGFAWNWMEPPLGTISFFLLCMQYARSQLQNLGAKPYTKSMLHLRAKGLCKKFPQYNKFVLQSFSIGDSLNGDPINH